MKVLGLDISTSCTGWCILDSLGSIIDIGYFDISKEKGVFNKAKAIEQMLVSLFDNHNIDKVFIEENLQSFRSGFSSAATISTLARFNGIVSFICFKELGFEPEFFNVNSARKSLGIKLVRKKDGGLPTKEQLFNWAEKNVNYTWPTKKLKSGPRKNQIIPDPRSYDMIDAYIISQAGLFSCK